MSAETNRTTERVREIINQGSAFNLLTLFKESNQGKKYAIIWLFYRRSPINLIKFDFVLVSFVLCSCFNKIW